MQNGTLVVTVGERNDNKNDLHNGKDNHDLHDKSKLWKVSKRVSCSLDNNNNNNNNNTTTTTTTKNQQQQQGRMSYIKENRFVSLEGTKYSETSKENHKNSTADEDNSVCDISSSNSNIVPIGTSRKLQFSQRGSRQTTTWKRGEQSETSRKVEDYN